MSKIIADLWDIHAEENKDLYDNVQNDAVIHGTGIMRYTQDKIERINPQDFYKNNKGVKND